MKPRLVVEYTDKNLMLKFKLKCLKMGASMSKVVLEFIKNFVREK